MAKQSTDASVIKAAGWRQGSVLPSELVAALCAENKLPNADGESLWMVISHSCDVTHESLDAEPWVEVILLEPLGEGSTDGNYQWLKNPRKIHVEGSEGVTAGAFAISIHEKQRLSREVLIDHEPADMAPLDARTIRLVANWVARRYTREAFPDAFNERCRGAVAGLRQELKSKGKYLTGVFVFLNSEYELDEDTDYKVALVGTVDPDIYEKPDQRAMGQQLLNAVEVALSEQRGIVVIRADLQSEAETTVDDLRYLRRLDFDTLSVRSGDMSQLPPNSP